MKANYNPEISGKGFVIIEGKPIVGELVAIRLEHAARLVRELLGAIAIAERDK